MFNTDFRIVSLSRNIFYLKHLIYIKIIILGLILQNTNIDRVLRNFVIFYFVKNFTNTNNTDKQNDRN
ncbi:hypothetical protein BN1088_630004 [Sphingobacterium sp. PM2-P1-29]|nr:hypothetical protein BN1088_630004 [Sphingobacterium sp. PM2-P1-29]